MNWQSSNVIKLVLSDPGSLVAKLPVGDELHIDLFNKLWKKINSRETTFRELLDYAQIVAQTTNINDRERYVIMNINTPQLLNSVMGVWFLWVKINKTIPIPKINTIADTVQSSILGELDSIVTLLDQLRSLNLNDALTVGVSKAATYLRELNTNNNPNVDY